MALQRLALFPNMHFKKWKSVVFRNDFYKPDLYISYDSVENSVSGTLGSQELCETLENEWLQVQPCLMLNDEVQNTWYFLRFMTE